jgi:hypothetical protein
MVNRKVYGYEVPIYSREEIQKRFDISVNDPVYSTLKGPNCWILPFVSEEVSVLGIRLSLNGQSELVTQRRITDAAFDKFGKRPWYEALQYAGLEVNGQVKNFLVALRTYWGNKAKTEVRILLKGSKMLSDSGLWVKAYGLFLTTFHDKVTLVCYDKGERDGKEITRMQYGKREASLVIERISDYYSGTGNGFDVLIDDAHMQGSIPMAPSTEFFSLKNPGPGQLFFSATETRRFSHVLGEPHIKTSCHCNVCEMLSRIVTTFDAFHYLRGQLVSFGAPVCDNKDFQGDQQAKSYLRKDLHTNPAVVLVEPYQRRAAIALSDEVPMKTSFSPLAVSLSDSPKIRSTDFVHNVGFCSSYESIEYLHFAGKNVRFYGVDPAILGTTMLDRDQPVTVSIGEKLDLLLQSPTPEIWCPAAQIIGYKRTGVKLGPYNQFVRRVRTASHIESKFSDVAGKQVIGDISEVKYTGGRYKATQFQVSNLSLQLTAPVLSLIGKMAGWDKMRYCVKSGEILPCCYPVIDHTLFVKVGCVLSTKKKPVGKTITKHLTYHSARLTFEVHPKKCKGSVSFQVGEDPVVEYEIDLAIAALRSGLEINPGPCHGEEYRRDYAVFQRLALFDHFYVFIDRIELRDPFHLVVYTYGSFRYDVILDAALQLAAMFRGRMFAQGRDSIEYLYSVGKLIRTPGDDGCESVPYDLWAMDLEDDM